MFQAQNFRYLFFMFFGVSHVAWLPRLIYLGLQTTWCWNNDVSREESDQISQKAKYIYCRAKPLKKNVTFTF